MWQVLLPLFPCTYHTPNVSYKSIYNENTKLKNFTFNKSNIWSVKCIIINVPGLAVVVGAVVEVDVVTSVIDW